MDRDDIITRRLDRLVHNTMKNIKNIISDCSLSDLEKIDEIEYIIKSYKKKR